MYYSQKSSCPKVETTSSNNLGKCTAKPPQSFDINLTYTDFKNNAETKYIHKIADHIALLVKAYPSLK
jgi:hypothetical protein